jgi:hypothetical protein
MLFARLRQVNREFERLLEIITRALVTSLIVPPEMVIFDTSATLTESEKVDLMNSAMVSIPFMVNVAPDKFTFTQP